MTFAAEVDELLRNLAKPPGSLGLLEAQARQVFLAWGNTETAFRPKHIILPPTMALPAPAPCSSWRKSRTCKAGRWWKAYRQ